MTSFRLLLILLFSSVTLFAQSDSLINPDYIKHSIALQDSVHLRNINLDNWGINPSWENLVDNYDPLKTSLNYPTLAGVGVATVGIGVVIHIYQSNAWWSGQKVPFHFQNDPDYALNVDKAGHFFGGALLAHLFSGALEAGNMQTEDAAIWGSALSFAFQMYVEIEDGFGPQWGFSPGDAAADFLGAGFTLAQYYYPFLKNFLFKFSYYPSKEYRDGLHKGNAIDDYNGQKFWLCFRVRNFLPDNVAEYWPEWLNLAAGVGIQNVDSPVHAPIVRNYYIGLDFDWESIPLYGRVWQFVKNTFNYIHLPMPGLRITNNTAYFVFLF